MKTLPLSYANRNLGAFFHFGKIMATRNIDAIQSKDTEKNTLWITGFKHNIYALSSLPQKPPCVKPVFYIDMQI